MNGILLIDKPEEWTSHDVVAKLRGILRLKRIGHSGTLDPMATGLLVIFLGRATRAVEFAENHEKEYTAGLRLGMVTDTQDTTGRVLETSDLKVNREELESVLAKFRGDIQQIPPMYSALKVNGQKLYHLARSGKEVERKPRDITINKLELIGENQGDYIISIGCSKGTYIRTLCHDIGQVLKCGGVMSSLRRTSVGNYKVTDACTLQDIEKAVSEGRVDDFILPVDSIFSSYPSITIDSKMEKQCRCGTAFKIDSVDGDYRVYSESGEFLMLGHVDNGIMATIKSFFEV